MADAMTPNTTVLRCPVKGCDFTHVEDTTPVPPEALAGVFGFGVMSAVALRRRARRLEGVLERHFDTHTALDWVRTVNELRQQLEEMMWDADTYTAAMEYDPVTEAVVGQGIGYYPGHDWRGPCAVTMAEHPGGIPTLSEEMRDRITQWAAPALRGQS